jgi:hypothetical protein
MSNKKQEMIDLRSHISMSRPKVHFKPYVLYFYTGREIEDPHELSEIATEIAIVYDESIEAAKERLSKDFSSPVRFLKKSREMFGGEIIYCDDDAIFDADFEDVTKQKYQELDIK